MLSVDILLIQSGGIHKSTFKSVGAINTELKLMKSTKYIGHSGYGLLLSTVYWTMRGYAEDVKNDVFDIVRDNLEKSTLDKYSNGLAYESLIIDAKKRLGNIDIDKSKNDVESLSSTVVTWFKR